ncbi:DUF448 domain-containing protein [Paraurantiacibacter namhicola]|uniref:YlxR domain-containing protein n=1 Tax=Paraurantiacibacter namhicola TaxID=645517 RepID=A0A1C7DAN4_9SPHN|nr:DUF448 domain-containing protein [Paraurantiacibacter namhicola]ANU08477.1 hypothetical protein A6F65_02192 [Paraurantiacibacter namhicola]
MRNPRNETLGSPTSVDSGGRDAKGTAPERRCILTGRIAPREELVRLAVSPDGAVLPDALARAPGRGAWIGVARPELEAAIADGRLKSALARAFKSGKLDVPGDLPELVENALVRSFLDRLGLEKRSGRLILGSDRIDRAARTGQVSALYHASDARDDGSRKLDQAWRVGSDAEGTELKGAVLPLDRATLSVALGRENVVHLALGDRPSAARVEGPLRRLQTYLGAGPPSEAVPPG